ncbi:MAG: DUF4912 domain-containing protein [Verrucomicrobiota bacterium]
MKKNPASGSEIPKVPGKSERARPARSGEPAPPPAASETPKSKPIRATRKPLLDVAVDTVKKILGAAPTPAKPSPEKTAPPKPARKNGVEDPKVEKVEVNAATVVRRSYTRKKKIEVPPILLEGDAPSVPPVSGPGEKFSLGATPPAQSFSGGELPQSYGTKKLFLTARDPHWLYANWDLTSEQQKELNAASTDGHLILRVYAGKIEGHPAYEIHVHPESRHWFAHVERAGNSYAAELGYYSALGKWMRVALSSGTLTPPDAVSAEAEAEFATIPFEFPFAKLMQIIEEAVRENLPLAVAIEELRRHGHPDLPRFSSSGFSSVAPSPSSQPGQARVWTPEQEKALARVINIDQTRRIWMGSLEITELIRRRVAQEVTSPLTAFGVGLPGAAPAPSGISSVTSPFGGQIEKARGFWFSVNAELIIYGATEPSAKVTLGGHEIKLRSDGTFSFRFALPDGQYDLPAIAVSADGTDGRAAELKFSRSTEYLGEVGATPQDPSLKPPVAASL